jgi:hypothetical protein
MPESAEKTPEQEAEERDRKLLAENAARIEGIVKLMHEKENRETADRKVEEARLRVRSEEAGGEDEPGAAGSSGGQPVSSGGQPVSSGGIMDGLPGLGDNASRGGKSRKSSMVFHPYKGKRVPITTKASRYLELGDALELQLQTREHGRDLLRALHGAAATRVKILERIVARGL